ncbi:MAG: tRNA (N(6)-L-threonylcarbamoyladenosine(37)-C(2))-methylthiotransferase MtaB [Desulfurivibrio sp.]|nr:tRNA (N(6)-L-threonylcarbamoyladenosine(37)-C(2))-methylthiotransferase MtaB [Desulfurivibrio sp.]
MGAETGSGGKRVAVTTLGCKVNQYESAAFLSELAERQGVEIVPFDQAADVYVINTCAVTARAGAQSRQLIRRAARCRQARLVVTGCYAQVAPQEVLELVGNPLCIVGNAHKERVAEIAAAGRSCDLEMYHGEMADCRQAAPLLVKAATDRCRAVLKVQDGCSQGCSYCIVPRARGRSRSVPPAQVLQQAEIFAAAGHREAVLTGIHLGHYGRDLTPSGSLLSLLEQLLARDLPLRYRLSSLESTEVGGALLALLAADSRLRPHLHIPLQSGDDRILRAMNRPYGRADFAAVIERCAATLPEAAIGVDVMTGFPGEDEAAFQQTYDLLAALPVSYLHVFPYSQRAGTPAARFSEQVPGPVRDRRAARLRELGQRKKADFYQRFLGQQRRVLVEGGSGSPENGQSERWRGYTDNYIPVTFDAPAGSGDWRNREVMVRLGELEEAGVSGRLAEGAGGRDFEDVYRQGDDDAW